MNYDELIEWLKFEFPHGMWLESTIFGDRCIASYFGSSRIIVRISKSKKIGIDLDKKYDGFSISCETLDEAKKSIIECLTRIDEKLIEDIQMSMF